ncbi:MAG TPA: hypothetical protein VN282_02540 [Pyrinomonadaceae bacterium]|nr:hypothetical protein [Pyrinomonadaceae bacterium]
MLKKCALLFALFTLLPTVGFAQEDGWITLTTQGAYGIRYDQYDKQAVIIVNDETLMSCELDPQFPEDNKVIVSPPSPLKKYVLVMCWDRGGKEAYVIDTRNNRVVSRDVVPKHWRVIKWVSWSPDERYALVAAAGEITMGDMAFADLASGRLQEIEFKNFTNNRGVDPRKAIQERLQDFDPNKVTWLSPSSFRLSMDVRCNPYELGGDCYEKVISSHPVRVNLNPFSINYSNVGAAGSPGTKPEVSADGSRRGKGVRGIAPGSSANIRQVDFRNYSYPLSGRCTSLLSRQGNIQLKSGESDVIKKAPYECVFSLEGKVSYGDLTGDGVEEALAYAGCRCANVETLSNFEESDSDLFVYTLKDGEAALLATFDYDDFSGQGYNRIYQSNFKDGTEIVSLSGNPKIEGGFLVLQMLAYKGNFRVDPPDYKVEMKYRWNGSDFVLAGRPRRWPCRNELCQ